MNRGDAGFVQLAFWWGSGHGTNDNIVNCACAAVMGTGNRRASSQAGETGEPQGKGKPKGELGIILAKIKGREPPTQRIRSPDQNTDTNTANPTRTAPELETAWCTQRP